ncbi:uncharacterized protein AB9W97_011852 isoform 1-T1 [Spinachia spinachia]
MWMLLFFSALLGVSGSPVAPGAPPAAAAQQLQALHCPPCERIHCSARRALKLQCAGGVTTGVCGCCPVCARAEGESCGGTWDYLGKCDEGLVCVYPDAAAERAHAERTGTCRAVIESLDPESCHPECTREYCQANPSEICSARSLQNKKEKGSDTKYLLLLHYSHASKSAVLQVRFPGGASMPGFLPAHLLFKLSAAETPTLPPELHRLPFPLPATLWEVCAQSPESHTQPRMPQQPADSRCGAFSVFCPILCKHSAVVHYVKRGNLH